MTYHPRDMEASLLRASRQFRVIALTGARQTGKSTLLRRLFDKTHRYVTLDNPQDLKLAQNDPMLFFQEYSGPLILDEIQYAPELLSYIKMAVDRSPARAQYLLTGSQQFTLMKNLRESLAGRIALFQLYPMSITEGPIGSRDYASRALRGAYPELLATRQLDSARWFASYLATYIERDVQTHYHLEQTTRFRDFIFLLAGRTSQMLNLQALSNDIGVSVPTIKSWVKILEISQIVALLPPYHVNLGSRIVKAPKLYFTDIGLVCHLTGVHHKEALWRGPQAGALFENFVIQELIKAYANRGLTAPLFYYRTNNNLEVDLIIEPQQGSLIPCEIKLNKTPHPGMVRSIERLRELNKKPVSILPGYLIAPIEKSRALTRIERAISLTDFLSLLPPKSPQAIRGLARGIKPGPLREKTDEA